MIGDPFEIHENMEADENAIARNLGLRVIEPPMTLKNEGSYLVAEINAPGFRFEDMNLVLKSDRLSFYAERMQKATDGDDSYFCSHSTATFLRREESLPFRVVPERASIRYDNSILRVEIPIEQGLLTKELAESSR